MGRPRKVVAREAQAVAIQADEPEAVETVPEPMPELKRCPRCQGEAHAWKDKHSLWRCACRVCGWWDSIAKYTEREARESYNASGGPAERVDSL
jgi:hypothetical protein